MKFTVLLVAAALSIFLAQAADHAPRHSSDGSLTRARDTEIEEEVEAPEENGEVELEEEEEEDVAEEESDEEDEGTEEEDQTEEFFQRRRIAQAFEFCLKKGDLTPIELVNCAADVILGGSTVGNPSFSKCLGEYVTSTGLVCSAYMAENKEAKANMAKVFKCIGTSVPNFVRCIYRSTPLPQKD